MAFPSRRHACFRGKVVAYTEGPDQAGFVANGLNYDATVRNRPIHGYLGIDNDTLWSIVQHDIHLLRDTLRKFEVR